MDRLLDFSLVFVVLMGLATLRAGRFSERIRLVAAQGVALAAIILVIHRDNIPLVLALLGALTVAVKGFTIPWLLSRSVREADGQQDLKPYIGFTLSLILGGVAVVVAFWLASLLPEVAGSHLIVPVSLATVLIGLLLLVGRKTAVNQVVGYLVLENGIFVFSFALAAELPTLVEMGILLDLFVAVFVMGIIIFHINREFDHIDTSRLRELDDLAGRAPRWASNADSDGPQVEERLQ